MQKLPKCSRLQALLWLQYLHVTQELGIS
jgi:hypothetical protein